jgi:glycerol-3-phosphate dehydrogenase subunit C
VSAIKGTPTPGLTYDPNSPVYWDAAALRQELDRVFEICQGCRLCFNLCPSFPELFQAVERHDGDVTGLTPGEVDRVIDTCFQCKICYVKCPYTPDDGHEFQLDFPRLLLRANAIRKKARGIDLRSRVLSRPEMLGKMAALTPGLANWANRQPLLRVVMEHTLGVHRQKLLPEFHGETFMDWFRKQPAPSGDASRAVLFVTCSMNYNNPQLGRDVLQVFAKNGLALVPVKANCCGMPAVEAGDMELARSLARSNVDALLPYVRAGKKILIADPTCSYMLRKEYAELVGWPEAKEISQAAMDVCEFLFHLKQEGKFNREFLSTPRSVAYHLPCHLKAQNIGFRSRDMMRLIPGTTIKMVEQCCGHDGTWAMKKEFFPLSKLAGKKAFEEMAEAEAEVLATDCPLAAVQFDQVLGRRPIHPIQVLARAYRRDGFPNAVPN